MAGSAMPLDVGPDGVPRITIGLRRDPNQPAAQGADPWASYITPPAQDAAPAAPDAQQPAADPWAAFLTPPKEEAPDDRPPKTFTAGGAAVMGAGDAATMGLGP